MPEDFSTYKYKDYKYKYRYKCIYILILRHNLSNQQQTLYDTHYLSPREAKKYYFADFVHIGGYLPPPPSLTDILFVKKRQKMTFL